MKKTRKKVNKRTSKKVNLTPYLKELGFTKASYKDWLTLRSYDIKVTKKQYLDKRRKDTRYNRIIAQTGTKAKIGTKHRVDINYSRYIKTQKQWKKFKEDTDWRASPNFVKEMQEKIYKNIKVNLEYLNLEEFNDFFQNLTTQEIIAFFKENSDLRLLKTYFQDLRELGQFASISNLSREKLSNRIEEWNLKKEKMQNRKEKAKKEKR